MRLDLDFGVSPEKAQALRERLKRLAVDSSLIEEAFVKGSGSGGQKINKTANCVQLSYPPLGLRVRCQRDRRLPVNRFLALRELVDEIELRVSPGTSERLGGVERLRKRKARRSSRARAKYADPAPPA